MIIKQDPITGLWCREDGAVLMPPCPSIHRFKYTWIFGFEANRGYRQIGFRRKTYYVHQIICRAFNGLAPADKPLVDHINRIKYDNRSSNLHWVDRKENATNQGCVDESVEKYGIRQCEDKQAYMKARYKSQCEEIKAYNKTYYEAHREELKAHARARYRAQRDAFDGYEEEYAKAVIKL